MFKRKDVHPEVATVCFAIHRECAAETDPDGALNRYLWRATIALERCPAEMKRELRTELVRVAQRLELLSSEPRASRQNRRNYSRPRVRSGAPASTWYPARLIG